MFIAIYPFPTVEFYSWMLPIYSEKFIINADNFLTSADADADVDFFTVDLILQ